MTPCSRSAISASASSHEICSNALALGAGAAQRVEDPVGAVDAVEEAVDLRAQLALAVRVVGAPRSLTATPSSTVTSHPHESGQSWWQVPWTTRCSARGHGPWLAARSRPYGSAVRSGPLVKRTGPATSVDRRPRRRTRRRPRRSPTIVRTPTAGRRVKVIGAGHSFTAAATDGVQIAGSTGSIGASTSTRTRPAVTVGRRHPPPPPQRRARRGRPGDAQPRRHRPPVDRRGDRHRHARHRAGVGNLATTVVGMELVTGPARSCAPTSKRAGPAARRPRRPRRPGHRHRGDAAVRAGVPPARPRDGRGARRRARRLRRAGRGRRPLRAVLDARRRGAAR